MPDDKQLFVKFVPWNVNTISALLNKTIKFSTVYEFNDFNEFHYLSPFLEPCHVESSLRLKAMNSFKEHFGTIEKKQELVENSVWADVYNKEYLKKRPELLNRAFEKDASDLTEDLSFIAENLAFSSVGIFCVSDLDVFKGDAAQVMFAHYANNLEGIALIYKKTSAVNFHEVQYQKKSCELKKRQSYQPNEKVKQLIEWVSKNYNDNNMFDFSQKSHSWNYEKEYRLFGEPRIEKLENVGLELVSILFTCRFGDKNKQTLLNIKENIYNRDLLTEEIYASQAKYEFKVKRDDTLIYDWLNKKIK